MGQLKKTCVCRPRLSAALPRRSVRHRVARGQSQNRLFYIGWYNEYDSNRVGQSGRYMKLSRQYPHRGRLDPPPYQ